MSALVPIVDHLLEERRVEIDQSLSKDEFFELFVSELITRDYGLSWDDIESGIVDGHNDGQIDAVYILVDDKVVREEDDFDAKSTRRNALIRLIVHQSKNKNGFEENSFSKMRSTLEDVLNFDVSLEQLSNSLNELVRGRFGVFRKIYLSLQGKNPAVQVDIYYATKGDRGFVSGRLQHDIGALSRTLEARFFSGRVAVNLLGARELIDLANRPVFINKLIPFSEEPTSDPSGLGWAGLVRLSDYFSFITDEEDRALLLPMFEENVRDFEGDVEVNSEIADTLASEDQSVDFWWLNNGITVLCDKATPHLKKVLSVDKPLIVNGLQTSRMIWRHFKDKKDPSDERHVLVRVVQANDATVRDRVIRSTNRQTPIGSSQLKATEQLHRDIENFFKTKGTFYERRKNYYKNQGKNKRDIFSIGEVAQAVISIVLARPNDARARPTSLLKNEKLYSQIFDSTAPLPLYHGCAKMVRDADRYLAAMPITRKERTDLRFYLAYSAAHLTLSKINPSKDDYSKLSVQDVQQEVFEVSYNDCYQKYKILGGDDSAAKGPALIEKIKASTRFLIQERARTK